MRKRRSGYLDGTRVLWGQPLEQPPQIAPVWLRRTLSEPVSPALAALPDPTQSDSSQPHPRSAKKQRRGNARLRRSSPTTAHRTAYRHYDACGHAD